MFSIKDGSLKGFENGAVKLSATETKWTSLEVRTHPTFVETLISKNDSGPVKPFLVHLYLKTERCIRLKLLV